MIIRDIRKEVEMDTSYILQKCKELEHLDKITDETIKILNSLSNSKYNKFFETHYHIDAHLYASCVIKDLNLNNLISKNLISKNVLFKYELLNELTLKSKVIFASILKCKIKSVIDISQLIRFSKLHSWDFYLSRITEPSGIIFVSIKSKTLDYLIEFSFRTSIESEFNKNTPVFAKKCFFNFRNKGICLFNSEILNVSKKTKQLNTSNILQKIISSICLRNQSFNSIINGIKKYKIYKYMNNVYSIIWNSNLKWSEVNGELVADYNKINISYDILNQKIILPINNNAFYEINDKKGYIYNWIKSGTLDASIPVEYIQEKIVHKCNIKNSSFVQLKVRIPSKTKTGDITYCNLQFCTGCKRFFVLKNDYEKFKNPNNANINFTNVSVNTNTSNQKNAKNNRSYNQTINIPTVITVGDFIVRSVSMRCIHSDHKLQSINAKVMIMTHKGMEERTVNATYCPDCQKFYMSETSYQALKKEGIICCKVIEYSDLKNNLSNFNSWQKKSVLSLYGYNVNKTSGLSVIERQNILKFLIENKILTKHEIISHLESQISIRKNLPSMKDAISKWNNDIDFIHKYKSNDISVKVRSIYAKKPKDKF